MFQLMCANWELYRDVRTTTCVTIIFDDATSLGLVGRVRTGPPWSPWAEVQFHMDLQHRLALMGSHLQVSMYDSEAQSVLSTSSQSNYSCAGC